MRTQNFLLILGIVLIGGCGSGPSDEELIQNYREAFKKKDWNTAITALDEIIERQPENADAYYTRAVAATNLRGNTKLENILTDLNKAITLDSTNLKALLIRFQANFLAIKFDDALKDIYKLIEAKGELPFLLTWKGNCAFATKKFNIAEKAYEKRLKYEGPYEDMKKIYYYWIYSKYFGGNKDGAMWDCSFLPNRGFEEDTVLMRIIHEDKLEWEKLVKFSVPQTTIEELEQKLN